MKILITGATGFVGKTLQSNLSSKGYEIYPTSRRYLSNYIHFDVRILQNAKEVLQSINPDVVVNLAWNASELNYLESKTNFHALDWNKYLYELVADSKVKKIISAGSSIEYLKENSTIYALTKRQDFENFERIFGKTEIEHNWIRIFQVYGPGQPVHKFIPTLISAVKSNQEFLLRQPLQVRDWIHVNDVATAIENLIVYKANSVLDIGTTIGTSNQEICESLSSQFGLKWQIFEETQVCEVTTLIANFEKELVNVYKSQKHIKDFLRHTLS